MKNSYLRRSVSLSALTMILLLVLTMNASAQISGTKNIPGDFPTLDSAISALNTYGVGAGGVNINLLSGNPQTAPAGGYSITATGTASNPIVISGNSNTITAAPAPTAGIRYDAILRIIGGDYITIQNFTFTENAANTTGGSVSVQQMTEFGVALFAASATDGAQYNTIQNNTITMSSATAYQNAIGIFSSCASSSTNGTLAASASTGTNSNNKFYGNIISGVQYGFYFISPVQTATVSESGNEIGGSTLSTGNTITFGISNTVSDLGFTSFSSAVTAGIYFRNMVGNTARYNTVTSGATLTLANAGIINTNSTAPSGITYTTTFSNNTITLTNTGTSAITGIDFGSGLSTGTIVCSDNSITLNQIASAATSAAITAIKANYASATNTASNNLITINQSNSTGATTSPVTAINCAGVSTTTNVTNNTNITILQSVSGTGSFGSGAITYIDVTSGGTTSTMNVTGNTMNTTGGSIRSTGTLTGVNNTTTINLFNVKNNIYNVDRIGASGTVYFAHTSNLPSELFDTISGNTITITGLSGSTTVSAINSLGGVSTTGTTKNINNNVVSITGTNTGTTKGIVTGYSLGNIKNNTVTINVAATAVTGIDGIGTGVGAYTISDNAVSITTSGVTPTIFGINCGATGPFQVYNNIFPVISATAASTSAPTIHVIQVAVGTTNNIYGNTIGNVSTGNGSGSGVVNGINVTGGTTNNIYKNRIADLSTNSAGSSTLVSGIRIGASTTANVYNNIIGNLTTPQTSSLDAIRGINITSSTTSSNINVSYNTVYLNATSSGTGFGTSGIYHTTSTTATTAALNMRNNIILNTSTPVGAGYTAAYRRSSTTLTNYGTVSNNNAFYAGTPGTYNVIFYDGTNNDQLLSAYKSRMINRDASSVTENINFVSTATNNANFLNINTSIATQIESAGIPITSPAITDDYAGNIRNTSTPDLGAFEGNYVLLDVTGPAISYIPLLNTVVGTNQTLTATITDFSGVTTSGAALPVLYYKINSGSYTPVQGISIGANQYTFTFGSATTNTGDTVYYYIAAQDNSTNNNVSVYPSAGASGFAINPPSAATPPTSPSSFRTLPGISGTYTVGATGATYTSLTGAGGLFSFINSNVVTGDININIIDNTTEDGSNPLNVFSEAGSGAGSYRINITPSGGALRTLTGTYAGGLIRLPGTDRVTIDGLNTGGDALTIINNSSTAGSAVIAITSLGIGQGATKDTIRNSTIICGGFATATYGIFIGGTVMGSNGDDNDYIALQNNNFEKAYYGVIAVGNNTASAGGMDGFAFTGNIIGPATSGTNNIGLYGMLVANAISPVVNNNTVRNLTASAALSACLVINTGCSNAMVSGNTITNCTQSGLFSLTAIHVAAPGTVVKQNTITGLNNLNTGGYAAYGIYVITNVTSSNVSIVNNTISDLVSYGDPSNTFLYQPTGIYLAGTSGGVDVYYNSVNIYGDHPGLTSATLFASMYVAAGVTAVNLKNNVFVNTYGNTSSTTDKSYAIYSSAPLTAFTSIDNNLYYVGGSGAPVAGFIGSDRNTLAAMQAGFGANLNSVIADPSFTAPTNLIPTSCFGDNKGTPVAGITTDFVNATRSALTPDPGAYEFTSPNTLAAPGVTSPVTYMLNATASPLTATGTATLVWYTQATGGIGSTTAPTPLTTSAGTTSYWVADSNTTTYCISPRSKIDVTVIAPNVSLAATGGTTSGGYPTLKDAFDAINLGTHNGDISITFNANTTETATALLNASGNGAASYTSVGIKPAGGSPRTISGSINATLIELNGADNVTIDGLNTGGNSLTIDNQSNGVLAGTVRFINDATSDTLRNCTVLGGSASALSGTIMIAIATATGNDNICISNNTIDASGSNLPANSIYAPGTAGMENSGVSILNNNIANFFSAGSVSTGINITAGATDWTISGNKFYQSAARTYTTANTHKAIAIAGGGNGFIISNNTIGYASSTGTGTYTMNGTIATRFIGIDLSVGTTTASSVQGNTIASISLATSSGANTQNGILCGINVTGGNVNIGTVSGNTIGVSTGTGSLTGTPTTTQGMIVGIHSSSTGTISIQNNTMGGFTSSGATAAVAGGIAGINITAAAASVTISNNTIGNTTANNMQAGVLATTTGSSIVSGINITAAPVTTTITGNTIQNLTSYGSGTAGYVRGIQTPVATNASVSYSITLNTINNLSTNAANPTLTSGQIGALGILIGQGAYDVVSQNTISNIAQLSTATTALQAAGISCATGTSTRITRNTIYGITNAGSSTSATAPATASGILVRSGTTSVGIYNNMISLGTGQTTNTVFMGVYCNHGSTPDPIDSIAFNTINITGTASSGSQPSYCVLRGDFSTTARTMTVDIRNNILTNSRSGGTGKHYALGNNVGTTASATGWSASASNNNVLNASASTIGYWTTDRDFASWKSTSGGDASSLSGVAVTYVNNETNLRLNMGITATSIESGGVPIASITTDIDGMVRPGPAGSLNGGGSSPDIGANEFDGVPLDVILPVISYTNLVSSCATGNRTLTATITDNIGVYTTGSFQPRIWYKKGISGTWYSQQGTLASGTSTNGTWNFEIIASDMNGLAGTDEVFYYVIAQDNPANNIASFPAGAVATNVGSVTTPPVVPSSFLVYSVLGASYTVNSAVATGSGNFQTIADLNQALATACMTGPVQISVNAAGGPYNGQIIVPAINGMSAMNRITINGNGATITDNAATTSTERAVIKLNGADYVTVKNFVINTGTGTYGFGIHLMNDADNDSIVNCTINGNTTSTSTVNFAGIVVNSTASAISTTGDSRCDSNVITGNTIIGGYTGIALVANGSTNEIVSNQVTNNNVSDFYFYGIYMNGNNGTLVEGNDFSRPLRASFSTFNGVYFTGNSRNVVVSKNKMHNTSDGLLTSTSAAYGVNFASCDAPLGNDNLVVNNVIYNFNGNGIQNGLLNTGSDNVRYYYNTILLTDNGSGLTAATRGFYQTTLASGIDFKNNIVHIGRASTGEKQCIYFNTTTSTITSDYNNFFVSATTGTINDVGYNNALPYTTLQSWISATNKDSNSVSVNPAMSSNIPTSCILNGKGTPIAGIATDHAGSTRSTTAPDIGAYEFTPAVISAPTASSPVNMCYGSTGSLSATGANTLLWFTSATGGQGSTTAISPNTLTRTSQVYYVADSSSVSGCISSRTAITVNIDTAVATNTISSAQVICTGATPSALTGSTPSGGNGSFTYQWISSTTGANAGFSNAAGTDNTQGYTPGALSATTWYRRIVMSGACGADTSAAIEITVNSPGLWTGAVSSAWNNVANWSCPQLPGSATNVTVPTGAPNMPVISDNQQANNITIQSGATLTLNSASAVLSIYGSITNNGTFNSTSGKLNMVGTSAQVIAGGTYSELEINNTNGVSLGGNVVLTDSLLLTGGVLTLGNNNLTLTANSYSNAGTAGSYIKTNGTGNVVIENVGTSGKTGNIIIPVGNSTFNPVVLSNAGTADNFTVWVIDSVTENYSGSLPVGNRLSSNAVDRTWFINESVAGGSNASVTLQWASGDELSGFNRTASYVSRYNGTTWMSNTTGAASGSNPYTQTRTGITAFSPFGVGSNTALPVSLTSFNATKNLNDVMLTWSTASEKNNKGFELQRSYDERNWENITFVKGKGNSNTLSNYSYSDINPFAGKAPVVYYRLKQVDFDGTGTLSHIVSAAAEVTTSVSTLVLPNPFSEGLNINISTPEQLAATIVVTDITGKTIATTSHNCVAGENHVSLNQLSELGAGMYFVTIQINTQTITHKVIKQ